MEPAVQLGTAGMPSGAHRDQAGEGQWLPVVRLLGTILNKLECDLGENVEPLCSPVSLCARRDINCVK